MTKQDDAFLNLSNPLRLRAAANGGGPMFFGNMDSNVLGLMRWAGQWTARNYLKNEVVTDLGVTWLCIADNIAALPPYTDPTNWIALTGTTGSASMKCPDDFAGADFTETWAPVIVFNEHTHNPRGITYDFPSNQIQFNYPGIWRVDLTGTLTFDADNGRDRTVAFRFFDLTQGIGTNELYVAIPKAINTFSFALAAQVGVLSTLGDTFDLEVRALTAADVVTNNVWHRGRFLLNQLSTIP